MRGFFLVAGATLGWTLLGGCDDETAGPGFEQRSTAATTSGTTTTSSAPTTSTATATGTTSSSGTTTLTGTGGESACYDADHSMWAAPASWPWPGDPSDWSCSDAVLGGGGSGAAPPGYDAGDTIDDAEYLGCIGDPDSDATSLNGVINGGTDVDWYWLYGLDLWGVADPYRSRGTVDLGLRVCLFIECHNGADKVNLNDSSESCPANTFKAQGPEGRIGCCTDDTKTEIDFGDFDFECNETSSDHAMYFLRVDGPSLPADACIPYTINYHL